MASPCVFASFLLLQEHRDVGRLHRPVRGLLRAERLLALERRFPRLPPSAGRREKHSTLARGEVLPPRGSSRADGESPSCASGFGPRASGSAGWSRLLASSRPLKCISLFLSYQLHAYWTPTSSQSLPVRSLVVPCLDVDLKRPLFFSYPS